MDDHDDLIERLQRLGRQPVDPAVQSAHLRAMGPPERSPLRSKLRVAGAFLAGLLVGGSGLAAAGALPDPAQNVAHDVLAEVGVQVPQPERYHDDAVCGGARGDRRNHGDYVRDDKSLAQTDCGKPVKGGPHGSSGGPGAKGERGPKASGERDACQGPPPWAGKGMTPEQKAAAQAERAARCGADEDAGESAEERSEAEADEREAEEPSTTTTAPPPTTTMAPTTTTPADPSTTTTAG